MCRWHTCKRNCQKLLFWVFSSYFIFILQLLPPCRFVLRVVFSQPFCSELFRKNTFLILSRKRLDNDQPASIIMFYHKCNLRKFDLFFFTSDYSDALMELNFDWTHVVSNKKEKVEINVVTLGLHNRVAIFYDMGNEAFHLFLFVDR